MIRTRRNRVSTAGLTRSFHERNVLKLHLPVYLQLAVYLHSFASILRHLQLHEFVKYAG
jgi:hypothetical protein